MYFDFLAIHHLLHRFAHLHSYTSHYKIFTKDFLAY